jgi:hypothetical protein
MLGIKQIEIKWKKLCLFCREKFFFVIVKLILLIVQRINEDVNAFLGLSLKQFF